MKCLNCGCACDNYLCTACTNEDVLEKIFNDIRSYDPENCENPYLAEYAAGVTEKYAERNIIPDILAQFDFKIAEYYYCKYYRMCGDPRFEAATVAYIQAHELTDIRTQNLLYSLINSYIPNDFIKPKKWCERIAGVGTLCCDMYAIAAKYFSMIGEYDLADTLVDTGLALCVDPINCMCMFRTPDDMVAALEKQKSLTNRYRGGKPYWPKTEDRRRAVAMFYDEKGITYPRIESRPLKVPENEFSPINEYFDDNPSDYCAFWCNDVFSVSAAKCIYQIAAVKVRDHKITDTFESYIRPWDARAHAKQSAAKEAGVALEVLESAEDVDLVMPKFFAFVEDDVLISTGALGNQAKLMTRAARYSGLREIKNEFYDILDLAADTASEFDLANNTREYLLTHFSLSEGQTALERALLNKHLYDTLINYGD